MEKGIQTQLLDYLVSRSHDFISVDQSAYLRNHSPQTCLHKVIDDWLVNLNDDLITAICFLDIQKCFDTIDHDVLKSKLKMYGIMENELKWFTSYMTNRKQLVICNGKSSREYNITIGVPQGSILGPALFLLYVNDITQHVRHGSCNLFADDSIIYTTGETVKEVTELLQANLNDVDIWYKENRLMLNADKSKAMLIKGKKKIDEKLNVTLDGHEIDLVNEVRYLGVMLMIS